MRLLLTTDTVGGVWTFSCELARELLKRGHEVLLVSFGRAPSPLQSAEASDLAKSGSLRYVSTAIALEWQPDNHSAYALGAPLLLRLCEQYCPDALLLSQFCYGALPVRAPKVVVAHSDVLSWADATSNAPLADDDWLRTYRVLVQMGLAGADLVVAPTAAMLDCLLCNFIVHTAARIISNGRSVPQPPTRPERQMRAMTAGRMWDPAKNLLMLRAAELPLPVAIAGESDGTTFGADRITCTGQLGMDALLAMFRTSAIYICCSRYEPFGLAALEAALCGCAVLAHDIPSLREVWGDGALYFQDADTLSSLLRQLCNDAALLAAAQARSSARAQRYTSAAMAEGYLRAIESLVSSRTEVADAA